MELNLFGKKNNNNIAPQKPALALSPGPAQVQVGGKGKELESVVEDVQKEVQRLSDSLNMIKANYTSLNEKLEKIEKNLAQLLSVYELIMNQVNPFLDEEEKGLVEVKEAKGEAKAEYTPPMPPVPVSEAKKRDVLLEKIDTTNVKVNEVVMDWLEFLLSKVGHQGIEALLNYYMAINWISEEVAEVLKTYAQGIKVENEPGEGDTLLTPDDHLRSLEYITRILELM